MPKYIVLSKLSPEGRKLGKDRFRRRPALEAEVERAEGKIIEQFATFGEFDFCTVISLPGNAAAQRIETASDAIAGVRRVILPAIDLPLFLRLCEQTTETTGPHRWQTLPPVRLFRRLIQPFLTLNRQGKEVFESFLVEGNENLAGVRGPLIFVANHSSHFDSAALHWSIPRRFRYHTYWGSAADRWFIKGRKEIYKQGWWRSLTIGSFPIHRGGGSKSLDYAKWLLSKGASVAIFPEGTRTKTGKLGKFRAGPALLATQMNVPVVPIYLHGLHQIMPPGTRKIVPGPVRTMIGEPMRFEPGTDIGLATRTIKEVMIRFQKECSAGAMETLETED